jgi:TP901 family phage tail tape measure protein
MASVGVESDVAATGIKNMALGLVAGAGATKSQQEAFAQLGLSAEDVAKRMQTDAQGTIIDVLSRIKELPKEMQASVLSDLFGKESINAIAPLLTRSII